MTSSFPPLRANIGIVGASAPIEQIGTPVPHIVIPSMSGVESATPFIIITVSQIVFPVGTPVFAVIIVPKVHDFMALPLISEVRTQVSIIHESPLAAVKDEVERVPFSPVAFIIIAAERAFFGNPQQAH
jgi:hypothetical protein